MTVIVVFLAVLIGFIFWWLGHQRIMSKPWLEVGPVADFPHTEAPATNPAKIGLGVFLTVVCALFALLISAYFMRMAYVDWHPAPMPRVLWLNTGMLVLSSVAMHCAVLSARRGERKELRLALAAATLTSLAFLVGQLIAWSDFAAQGYFASVNPASSFFYLLTGLHGLHVLGGLVALGRVDMRAFRNGDVGALVLSTELCATYWHVLLAIWLLLFVVLLGWAASFIDICRMFLGS